jgi:hypothetical protein
VCIVQGQRDQQTAPLQRQGLESRSDDKGEGKEDMAVDRESQGPGPHERCPNCPRLEKEVEKLKKQLQSMQVCLGRWVLIISQSEEWGQAKSVCQRQRVRTDPKLGACLMKPYGRWSAS